MNGKVYFLALLVNKTKFRLLPSLTYYGLPSAMTHWILRVSHVYLTLRCTSDLAHSLAVAIYQLGC